jgi:hypothetical protein
MNRHDHTLPAGRCALTGWLTQPESIHRATNPFNRIEEADTRYAEVADEMFLILVLLLFSYSLSAGRARSFRVRRRSRHHEECCGTLMQRSAA